MIKARTLTVTDSCPRSLARTSGSWVLEDFVVDRLLGQGETSKVFSATARDAAGTRLVLKTYDKHRLSALNVHQVRREIDIHAAVTRHKHVLDMWGAFEDDDVYVIMLELGKGDLKDLVDLQGGRLSEASAAAVMRQVLSALEHLHSMGIAHRDVKPENVVVAMDGTLKLADFGLSIDLSKERAVTRVGTLDFMAPEVVSCPCKRLPQDNKGRSDLWYGFKADSWSCGVMAYELVTGKALFCRRTPELTALAIAHRAPHFPFGVSDAARRFVKRAVAKEMCFRPTIAWLLAHEFICGGGQACPPCPPSEG